MIDTTESRSTVLRLMVGDVWADVCPSVGGALLGAGVGRQLWFCPVPRADGLGRQALFPLVPWANRILGGGFMIGDRRLSLPEDPALHGHGWRVAWTVAEQTAASVVIEYRHRRGDGFSYTARLRYMLDADGLDVRLEAANDAEEPMPIGLGLHPFFPCDPGSRLEIATGGWWSAEREAWQAVEAKPVGLPDRLARPGGAVLPTTTISGILKDWDGTARLHSAGRTLTVSSDARLVHLYAPAGRGFLCLEPVSHSVDAHNHGRDAPRLLAHGERASIALRVEASA